MRRSYLVLAAVALMGAVGCGNSQQNSYSSGYSGGYYGGGQQVAAAPAPRTSLYPMTQPPPGAGQPLQGSSPTRISATQDYGYQNPGVMNASYNPQPTRSYAASSSYGAGGSGGLAYGGNNAAGGYDPFAGMSGTAFRNSAGAVCRVEDVTPYSNPNVPMGDPPVIENRINVDSSGGVSTYPNYPSTATTTFTPGTYAATTASYTPPATTARPMTLSSVAPVGGTYGSRTTTTTTTTYGAATTYPSPATTYAPPATTYAPPATTYAPPATTYAPPATTYAPPATTYAPPATTYAPTTTYQPRPYGRTTPYNTTSYGSASSYGTTPQTGVHYGPVEGTADIAIPVAGAVTAAPSYAGGAFPTVSSVVPAAPGGYAAPAPMEMMPAAANTFAAPSRPAIARPGMESSVQGIVVPNAMAMDKTTYRLVPATDIPPGIHPGDVAPSQWFEVIRPGNGPVRVGRLSATCTCVGVRIPKRSYEAGERILIEARSLSRPARNNLTYGIYVNLVEPIQTVVDADVTISF